MKTLKIKASAGSGKTYRIGLSFLEHLANKKMPDRTHLRSILAITFTNKAVEEMKSRIIGFLKEIALNTPKGKILSSEVGLSSEEASKWLSFIFEHYDDFRVQTIDSFVFQILQVISLELNKRPDLEVEFNTEKIFNRAFDKALLRFGSDPGLKNIFLFALKTYLEIEKASGFNPEKIFRKTTLKIFKALREKKTRGNFLKDFSEDQINHIKNTIQNLALKILKSFDLKEFNSQAKNFLEAVSRGEIKDSKYFGKESLKELLKKDAKGKVDETREELFKGLKKHYNEYLLALACAKTTPYKKLLEKVEGYIEGICHQEGLILEGDWLKLVKTYLDDGKVPQVYLYLGQSLKHFLIDEFQDISHLQWHVLYPLIENSLSEGGSLIYVGDPKQSIYMWRDAQPDLFDKVENSFPYNHEKDVLTKNWRSLKGIVEFNNNLFSCLKDKVFVKTLVSENLKDLSEEEAESLCSTVKSYFDDVIQEAVNNDGSSSVVIMAVENENSIKEGLCQKISELIEEGVNLSDVAILNRTNEEAFKVFSWLCSAGIPVITENSLKIEKSEIVKTILNFMRYLTNPHDEIALVGILENRAIAKFLEEKGIFFEEDFIIKAKEEQRSLGHYIKEKHPLAYEILFKPFRRWTGYETAYDVARKIVEYFSLKSIFPEEKSFLARFFELINSMEERSQKFFSISEFIEAWEEEGVEEKLGIPEGIGAKIGKEIGKIHGAVRAMTIHKAKGLEFPIVFVLFVDWKFRLDSIMVLEDGKLVKSSKPYPEEIAKERSARKARDFIETLNLFYVAFTRAKERLFIFLSKERESGKILEKMLKHQKLLKG